MTRQLASNESSQAGDREFLMALGVTPYDVEEFEQERRERLRSRVLGAIAITQMLAIAAGLVWTAMR